MCDVREAVRLPGMINMNIEARKLKEVRSLLIDIKQFFIFKFL